MSNSGKTQNRGRSGLLSANYGNEKGTVLIVGLLVLLVLAAIAIVSVNRVATEMASSGNFRISKMSGFITEGGLEGTMAMAAENPVGFNAFVFANGFQVSQADISPIFWDTGDDGSFGKEVGNISGVNFVTTLSQPITTNRVPGYSVGSFCYNKFNMFTDGFYGTDTAVNPDDVLRNSQKRYSSSMYVGPVLCP
ncbi:MAG: hypothetical protein FJ088_10620 [Deltaproteobacteria bacterium]|nr:hypothetical protein [Deltaproteobacteria bacterium]